MVREVQRSGGKPAAPSQRVSDRSMLARAMGVADHPQPP